MAWHVLSMLRKYDSEEPAVDRAEKGISVLFILFERTRPNISPFLSQ